MRIRIEPLIFTLGKWGFYLLVLFIFLWDLLTEIRTKAPKWEWNSQDNKITVFNRLQSINVFSEMSENHHIEGYVFFNPSKEKSLSSTKVSIQGLCLISLLLGYKLSLNMDECYIIMAQSIPSMSIPLPPQSTCQAFVILSVRAVGICQKTSTQARGLTFVNLSRRG